MCLYLCICMFLLLHLCISLCVLLSVSLSLSLTLSLYLSLSLPLFLCPSLQLPISVFQHLYTFHGSPSLSESIPCPYLVLKSCSPYSPLHLFSASHLHHSSCTELLPIAQKPSVHSFTSRHLSELVLSREYTFSSSLKKCLLIIPDPLPTTLPPRNFPACPNSRCLASPLGSPSPCLSLRPTLTTQD